MVDWQECRAGYHQTPGIEVEVQVAWLPSYAAGSVEASG